MSVVYAKLLLLIVAVAIKWRVVAFLIDIYIYIHISKNENKKDVYKKQTREKQTYNDYLWRGI